jgi:hypothetical protein
MRGRLANSILLLLLAGVLLLCLAEPALACPTCKETLAGGESNIAQGYAWSIIFMLSMPPLIFGGLSLYFYLLVRADRLRRVRAAALPLEAAGLPSGMTATMK